MPGACRRGVDPAKLSAKLATRAAGALEAPAGLSRERRAGRAQRSVDRGPLGAAGERDRLAQQAFPAAGAGAAAAASQAAGASLAQSSQPTSAYGSREACAHSWRALRCLHSCRKCGRALLFCQPRLLAKGSRASRRCMKLPARTSGVYS